MSLKSSPSSLSTQPNGENPFESVGGSPQGVQRAPEDEALVHAAKLWIQASGPEGFDAGAAETYVDGQLDAEEAKAFESLMAMDPHLAAEVEKVRQARSRIEAAPAESTPPPRRLKSWWILGWVSLALLAWLVASFANLL